MTAPADADARIQVRVSGETAAWLAARAARMTPPGPSVNVQARAEIAMWRACLAAELRRVRLTLAQAGCIADVLAAAGAPPAIASPGGRVHAECEEAFTLARGAPLPGLSSYGARWAPGAASPAAWPGGSPGAHAEAWERDLLAYLRGLGPAADHALADAISQWLERDLPRTPAGFAAAGLRVTEGGAR